MSNPKMLPAPKRDAGGPLPDVAAGLTVAMEGINIAITSLLHQEDDPHRYAEVLRMATIGKALERQRARASKRVSALVSPHARNDDADPFAVENLGGVGQANFVCGAGGRGDMGEVEDLAREPVDAPADREPHDPLVGGPGGYGLGRYRGIVQNEAPPPHIGAPYGVGRVNAGQDPNGALMDMAGGLGQAFSGMVESREEEAKSSRRLDRAKEIDALSKAMERTDDPDKRVRLQRLIDAATDALEESVKDPSPNEAAPGESAPSKPCVLCDDEGCPHPGVISQHPPHVGDHGVSLRGIVCVDPGCGNAHDVHWTTPEGEPLNCDVCNGPMVRRVVAHIPPEPEAAAGQHAAEER